MADQKKDEFVNVCNLFPSKSGNSFTVFLNDEILGKLSEMKKDYVLGISENKFGGISVWFIKRELEAPRDTIPVSEAPRSPFRRTAK